MAFDYARLSLAEIRDDLAETLSDQVVNAGQEELASLLNAIEDEALVGALSRVAGPPSEQLVKVMYQLVELEPYGHLPEPGIQLAGVAIQELRRAGGLLDG
jgi:hypothetical protein